MNNLLIQRCWIGFCLLTLVACQTQKSAPEQTKPAIPDGKKNADELLIVDCLLPGKVRKLGSNFTYLSARKAIKTSAVNCSIRGGEYTAYDRSNYVSALKIWLPLAKQGDAKAQAYVAEIYEKGLGIAPDYKVAVHWYQQAAKQGSSEAQLNLGYLYEQGLGVEKDLITALNWYRKASGIDDDIGLELGGQQNLQQVADLKAEVKNQQARAQRLEQELKQAQQERDQALKQLRQRKRDAESQRNRLQQLQQQLRRQRDQALLAGNQAEAQRITQTLAKRDQALKTAQQEVASLREELGRLQGESKYKQQQVAQTNQLQTQVVSLQSELTSSKQLLDTTQDKLMLAQTEVDKARKTLQAYQQLNAVSQMDQTHLQQLKIQLQTRERELDKQNEAMATLQGESQFYRKELAKLQAAQKAQKLQFNASLQNQLKQFQTQTKTLTSQLSQERAAVAAERKSTQRLQQELEQLRQQSGGSEKQEKLIGSLERSLIQKRKEFAAQKEKMAKLEGEMEFYREQLLKMDNASQKPRADTTVKVAQAKGGPVIELIDPPLTNVRGIPVVKTRSVVKRPIVGKAIADQGMLAITVNDARLALDKNNLFFTEIIIAAEETPVNIVAIDRQGRRTTLDFKFTLEAIQPVLGQIGSASRQGTKAKIPKLAFGNYYALVIGNNDYKYLTKLDTALNDARRMTDILRKRYGFEVTLLENATRYDILSGLNQLREKLTEKDNLLVYYAGHGQLDKLNVRGYWLPVDAEPRSSANWIKNVDVTDVLNAMTAQHILVIADSCYSGAFARSALARLEAGMSDKARLNWIKEMLKKRSRTVFTSGGLKPVLDAGGGDHSVFAKALFQVLDNNQTVLEGRQVHQKVAALVAYAAAAVRVEQIPEYSPVQHAGHEAGDFFFVPKL